MSKGYPVEGQLEKIIRQVDALEITGNVIPFSWYQHLTGKTGKVNLAAVMLLAEIVYWYRPAGNSSPPRKKFEGDMWQISQPKLAKKFNMTTDVVIGGLAVLEEKGIIQKKLVDKLPVMDKYGKPKVLGNVLFIELFADKLKEITYPIGNLA